MNLTLYDTLTKQKKEFKTLKPNQVAMYVCGVTPYDTSHLGHASVFIFFDTLKRVLMSQNYTVNYVQNITDIDDPLIERAQQLHTTWEELADKWTQYLLNDFDFLNIMMPDHYVKATQELGQMITIIEGLIKKGFAYQKEGNVYFSISKFPLYGKLSDYSTDEMLTVAAERGGDITDPNKQNPLDFLLWKTSKEGEPAWNSPWGMGRPGWHIECTAMSTKYLGEQIDIHGGGSDLIFPHHESEIAQAEGYSSKHPFVAFWMHCAMVYYQGEKMSKSLGNLVYVQDLAKNYSANEIRYFLLSHHYRSEWEYTDSSMEDAASHMRAIEEKNPQTVENNAFEKTPEAFRQAVSDDMNIGEALKILESSNNAEERNTMYTILGFKNK